MADHFLSELCLKNFVGGDREEAEMLLEKAEKPHLLTDKECGKTLLHWAARWGWYEIVEKLIKRYCCDPMVKSTSGWTPLQSACAEGHINVIKYLITECHCDPMCKDNNGATLLHIACRNNGNLDVVRYLIEECILKCDPMCKTDTGLTPLHDACSGGHVHVVKYLITQCNCHKMCTTRNGTTPLHLACQKSGNLEVVRYLIEERGCSPQYKQNNDWTPLHSACAGGHIDVVKYLITECHCDPMCKDNNGATLLHIACCNNGNLDVVRYLIEYKCDPMCKTDTGLTPLHSACAGGHVDVVKYLLTECHCVPMCKTHNGTTPLHVACQKSGNLEVVCYLIEECGCSPQYKQNDKWTPLHLACAGGHIHVVKYLITKCYCDPLCEDNYGITPLHSACSNGRIEVVNYLIKYCKECGRDPMCRANTGLTPLHIACARGQIDVVKYLITQCKCDPRCRDKILQTPLHVACDNGQHAVAEYLLSTGCVNPTSRDMFLMSPQYYAKDDKKISLLLKMFSHLDSRLPIDSYANIFLLGDSGVGKTTLAEVIRVRVKGVVFGQYRRVSAVQRTAGIIPHRLEHRELGNIILHDVAGQPEYDFYHRAVLENMLQGSAAVFIIVVKLSEDAPYRWLSLVKDLSRKCSGKSYLLTVASYKDAVERSQRCQLKKKLNDQISSFLNGERLVNKGTIYLDCRKLDSKHFSEFKDSLSTACQSVQTSINYKNMYKSQDVMLSRMLYLLMETNEQNVYVYPIDKLWNIVESKKDYFLPETKQKLLETLSFLHCTGLIMFINSPGGSWVVFRKEILLAEVNGKGFAPHTWPEASSTGIISKRALCRHLTDYDQEMLVEFVLSVKLCGTITPEIIEMTNLSPNDSDNAESELLFFPALMSYCERPVMFSSVQTFQFGWCLQCSDEHSFFSPRFLHLLILYLVNQPMASPHNLRCTIWSRSTRSIGILCSVGYGVKLLVELVDDGQWVILLMSCQERNMMMIPVRRKIINDILSIKEEVCPSIQTKEFVIDNSQLDYPIDKPCSLVLFNIKKIASCIHFDQSSLVSHTKNSQGELVTKTLCDLLPLEHDKRQDMSIFAGRDIKILRLPVHDGQNLPDTISSSPVEVLNMHIVDILFLVSDPVKLVNDLYSARLLSDEVIDEIMTTKNISRFDMAIRIMNEVERYLSGTNTLQKFNELCVILKKQSNEEVQEIVKKMEEEVCPSHDQ